jgi:soluble lytic murein transglycosylase-like protein
MPKNKYNYDKPIPVVKNVIFERQLKITIPNKFKKLIPSMLLVTIVSAGIWLVSLTAGETVAAGTVELNSLEKASYKIFNADGSISKISNSFYNEQYKTIRIGDHITRYPLSSKEDKIMWIDNLIQSEEEKKKVEKNALIEKLYSILGNEARTAIVYKYANYYKIPEFLVAAVIFAESSNYATAVSKVGARGLMQLMPDTAVLIARMMGMAKTALQIRKDPEVLNTNEEINIKFGCAHLKDFYNKTDSWEDALHAYNQGYARYVKGYRSEKYVANVFKYWNKFKKL